MTQPISVLVVDDHKVVRDGVRYQLERAGGMVVCGEAGDVAGAVAMAGELQPDVAVIDLNLPDGSGIEATKQIKARRPETQVVIFTFVAHDELIVIKSIRAGASAYILKSADGAELVLAVRSVAKGDRYLNPAVTAHCFKHIQENGHLPNELLSDPRMAHLSPQQRRVVGLVVQGKRNKTIAGELKITEKTVKNHITAIFEKLGVANRGELAAWVAGLL